MIDRFKFSTFLGLDAAQESHSPLSIVLKAQKNIHLVEANTNATNLRRWLEHVDQLF